MVVVALIGLAGVAAAFAMQGRDPNTVDASTGAVAIASATSFDPQGDNQEEHEDLVPNAIDQDPTTAWKTEHYGDAEKMAGKDGVGLVLELDGTHDIDRVDVRSPEGGWSAQVYVADGDAPTDLAGWGEPVSSVQGAAPGLTRFRPISATGDRVLLWFTRTADSGEVTVSEASVHGP